MVYNDRYAVGLCAPNVGNFRGAAAIVNCFDDPLPVHDTRAQSTVCELLIEETSFYGFDPTDGKF